MSKIEVITLPVTPLAQNCRILADSQSGTAIVVDPGGEVEKILNALSGRKLECKEIWLTHSHLDHCGGVAALKQETGAILRAHPGEADFRANVRQIAAMYGLEFTDMDNCPEPDFSIIGGEKLHFGDQEFEVLFTPGHSPGHVVFYNGKQGYLIGGDTVFAGSIGRTDFPGCSHPQLLESIRSKILCLPPATRILPGHGEDTSVGIERETNPFLGTIDDA